MTTKLAPARAQPAQEQGGIWDDEESRCYGVARCANARAVLGVKAEFAFSPASRVAARALTPARGSGLVQP